MVNVLASRLLSLLALVLLIVSDAAAQTPATGQLTGTVTDPQGAVVPRATILVRNDRTRAEFRTMTNGVGIWGISSVPSGTYTVTIRAQGFKEVSKETRVDAGSSITLDATLQIGFSMPETIVTASKFEEEVLDAPAMASVIPEQTIRYSPSRNVANLLSAVPGMNVVQTSAGSFGISGRAASSVYGASLVLIDGRRLNQDYAGFVPWSVVPINLDEIKQIEVIRGPASAIWGTYAMNGVVNIITTPPREMVGTTFTLGAGTFDRSGGAAESNTGYLYYVNASHARVLNDRWAFKITGGALTQDAFARPTGTLPNQYPYPEYANKGTTQPKVDGRVHYDLPDGKQHFTFAGGYAWSSGIQHEGTGGSLVDASSSYSKVDYVRGTLRIAGYINNFALDGTSLLRVYPTGQPIAADADSHEYHLELSDLRKVRTRHLISYGGSFRHASFKISDAPGATGRNEAGIYFQDEIQISDRFRWIVGARLDKFDFIEGVVLSPRTTFMIKPAPGHTFRASYNRAYMAPDAFANYWQLDAMSWIDLGAYFPALAGYSWPFRLQGTKNLKEQSLDAFEAGYTAVLAGNRVHLGAAFYINEKKREVYWQFADSYTSQNPPPGWPLPPFVLDLLIAGNAFGPGVGLFSRTIARNRPEGSKTINKGFELSADARINRFVDVYANYSWQAKPEAWGFPIAEINLPPSHRVNASLNFDYKRFLGNVSVDYVDSAYWVDVVMYAGTTKAYTAVNTSIGARLDGGGRYTVMLKASNLANERIQNHIYGDVLGRQVTGELKMRF